MLLKENSVFFADKKYLNDPTDCSPSIQIDVGDAEIHDYAEKIIFEDSTIYPKTITEAARQIANNATSIPTIKENFWAWKFFNLHSRRLREGETIERIFASEIVNFHIEEAKVFSLSRVPSEPRMWAHYGDSHKGICIEFEIDEGDKLKHRIGDVEYTTKRPMILASEIMAIPSSTDNAAKTLLFNKMFLTKSNGWSYEQESRLFIPKSEELKGIVTLDLPEGEYRRVSAMKITGIIFGLNIK
jgi:hypothetical protein